MPVVFAQLDIEASDFTQTSVLTDDGWLPHFNTNGYDGNWNVLTLRSPGGSTDNIFADLHGHSSFADTEHMQHFPEVKKLVESLECETMSVRLLNLKAGAVIHQHRDNELAFERGEARLHFPILTNPGVEFFVNDTLVTMLPGQCWYINANMPHRVANYGTSDRIHLVIDCVVNDWLKDVFSRSKRTEIEEPINTEQTLMIIEHLRMHGTETSNQLADKLQADLQK